MTVTLLRGNALALPLADATVDLVVTSPPYFGLRSYQDGGEHYAGQIGSEATPAEWLSAMLAATREMVRVLKPCGSIWVNLGDKYSQRVAIRPSSHQDGLFPDREDLSKDWKRDKALGLTRMPYQNVTDAATGSYPREKSLIGLPWRYALACIDTTRRGYLHIDAVRKVIDDLAFGEIHRDRAHDRIEQLEAEAAKGSPGLGLILRAEVIWSKPNGLPESVTDRVRRSHEQWFHFTVQPRYFSAVDEIREASSRAATDRRSDPASHAELLGRSYHDHVDDVQRGNHKGPVAFNPLGKLPGSVWSIPSQPLIVPPGLGVDHFAAFPMEWPRRLIAGWSPSGVCTVCGEGRRPVGERDPIDPRFLESNSRQETHQRLAMRGVSASSILRTGLQSGQSPATRITGYVCGCPTPDAPTRPSVVLDPFGGTGTTALVAHVMGRHGISVDMSADYTRLAAWRTTDPGELAKAAQVEKPAAQVSGQDHLFHLEGA